MQKMTENTEIKTEYAIQVTGFDVNNLSLKRTVLKNFIYLGPLSFIIFLMFEKKKKRRVYD